MYPGPFCEKYGLSKDQLLNRVDSLVPVIGLQNGTVLELCTFLNKNRKTELDFTKILISLEPRLSDINQKTLISKINRLVEQRKKLSHKKKVAGFKDATDLLNRLFELPASSTVAEPLMLLTESVERCSDVSSIPSECAENTELPKTCTVERSRCDLKIVDSSMKDFSYKPSLGEGEELKKQTQNSEVSKKDINPLKYEHSKLKKQNNHIEREIEHKLEKLSVLESRIGHYSIKNVNKRDETAKKNLSFLRASERGVRQLKHALTKIETNYQNCKQQLAESETQNKELVGMIEELRKVKEICEQESKKKVSAQKNASYLRLELQRKRNEAHENANDEINDLKALIRLKEYEIDDMRMQIADLEDHLRTQFNTKNEDGSYKDNI